MKAVLSLALALLLPATLAHAGVPQGPPPPPPLVPEVRLHVEGAALWSIDEHGIALLVVEDLRLSEPLLVAGLPAILETHVRRIAFVYPEHAPEILPLAADSHRGCAVWRYNLAEVGRFVQRDPVGRLADYTYAANRPTMLTDPSGSVVEIPSEFQKEFEQTLAGLGIKGWNPDLGITPNRRRYSRPKDGDLPAPEHGAGGLTEMLWRMILSTERTWSFENKFDIGLEWQVRQETVNATRRVGWAFADPGTKGPAGYVREGVFTGDPAAFIQAWFQEGNAAFNSPCSQATRLILLEGVRAALVTGPGLTDNSRFNAIFAGYRDLISEEYRLKQMISGSKDLGVSGIKRRNVSVGVGGRVAEGGTETVTDQYDWVPGDAGYIPPWNFIYLGGTFKTGAALFEEKGAFFDCTRRANMPLTDRLGSGAIEPWRLSIDTSKLK